MATSNAQPHSIPLVFEENRGQIAAQYTYIARTPAYTLAIAKDHWLVADQGIPGSVLKISHAQESLDGTLLGENRLSAEIHYLKGRQKEKWIKHVPTYTSVLHKEISNGVDLRYRFNGKKIEYDYIIKNKNIVDPIRFKVEGAKSLYVSKDGSLSIETSNGVLNHSPPILVFPDSKEKVTARFVLAASNWVEVYPPKGSWKQGTIVDPVVSYVNILGSSENDVIRDVAYDSSNNVYVLGSTTKKLLSKDDNPFLFGPHNTGDLVTFPPDPCSTQAAPKVDYDIFVSKLDPAGGLISTFVIGGCQEETGVALAVDRNNGDTVYVVGSTVSSDFPLGGVIAYPSFHPSGQAEEQPDVIAFKLDSALTTLEYVTYLGGKGADRPRDVVVASDGTAYIVGNTQSAIFEGIACGSSELDGPLQCRLANSANHDAFVLALAFDGSSIKYGTFFGGQGEDWGASLALVDDKTFYLSGTSGSSTLPTRGIPPLFQNYHPGVTADCGRLNAGGIIAERTTCRDAFVARMSVNTSTIPATFNVQSFTYLGGDGDEEVSKMTRGPGGEVFVVGTSLSGGVVLDQDTLDERSEDFESINRYFPLRRPFLDSVGEADFNLDAQDHDAFIFAMPANLDRLIFSTFLKGSEKDSLSDLVVVDGVLNDLERISSVYTVGYSQSKDFKPINNGFDSLATGSSLLIARLDYNYATQVLASGFSTLYGGEGLDFATSLALNQSVSPLKLYVVGGTASTLFPNSAATPLKGKNDGVLLEILDVDTTQTDLQVSFSSSLPGETPIHTSKAVQIQVSNPTGSNPTRYRLNLELGRGFQLVSTLPSACTQFGTSVFCDSAGELAVGASELWGFTVNARLNGSLTLRAFVSTAVADRDMKNNIASANTQVPYEESGSANAYGLCLILALLGLGRAKHYRKKQI
ncbi:MAG: SBBP repeat-containing protein [Gammaproteobacteria bacterium]|nr:SBBP repeat-containing protein [Gammaproteobacteria bacterium]